MTQYYEARRGTCNRCSFRQRLRKDGMVGEHFVYHGSEREYCWGSLKPARGATQGIEV